MEHARTSPARAGINRLIAVGGFDPMELRGDQLYGLVPWHGHEWLNAPPRTVTLDAVLQPTSAHHRLCNAALRVHSTRHGFDDAARPWVFGERPHTYDP